ncbi:MAG: TetR/AcrR family transcriptional regulator [Alphaproteobacteria bacterium]
MRNPYKRKKEPKLVRRNLLDQAAKIAVGSGLSAVTVSAVSAAAGVSKGGFTHHFPSKQDLIDALFEELLNDTEAALSERIKADTVSYGAFTRAYIDIVLNWDTTIEHKNWAALAALTLNEPQLCKIWADWFSKQVNKYQETDLELVIVRLAVDGFWLSNLIGISLPKREQLYSQLIKETYIKDSS